MQKNQYPMPSDRLWKTVGLWCRLFMGSTALIALAFTYRLVLLSQIPGDLPMDQYSILADYLPQADAELWTSPVAGLLYLICYVACIFLVLKWYLRSVRNARAMFSGIETSPGFVVWAFIIPFISWWKPYGMHDERAVAVEPEPRWLARRH
jgi:hypothetical protein